MAITSAGENSFAEARAARTARPLSRTVRRRTREPRRHGAPIAPQGRRCGGGHRRTPLRAATGAEIDMRHALVETSDRAELTLARAGTVLGGGVVTRRSTARTCGRTGPTGGADCTRSAAEGRSH